MSYPVEADLGILKYGDGADPEVFTVLCGVQNVTINEVANTQDKTSYDCAKPGKSPVTTIKVINTGFTVSGSGVTNIPKTAETRALLGKHINWEVDLLSDDGTDEGDLLGTYKFQGVLTSRNTNVQRGQDSGIEYQIQGEYDLTWTPAA